MTMHHGARRRQVAIQILGMTLMLLGTDQEASAQWSRFASSRSTAPATLDASASSEAPTTSTRTLRSRPSWRRPPAPSVEGEAAWGENFGQTLVTGDFDGDGSDDLAVGVPRDVLEANGAMAGAVNVFYGSPRFVDDRERPEHGLQIEGNQLFRLTGTVGGRVAGCDGVGWLPNLHLGVDSGDEFGRGLAAGDFNDDGYDDLAIGVPGKRGTSATRGTGIVIVLWGSDDGLVAEGSINFASGAPALICGRSENRFGETLLATDMNFDGVDDLVIGAPGDRFQQAQPGVPFAGWVEDAGQVTIRLGAPDATGAAVSTFDEGWVAYRGGAHDYAGRVMEAALLDARSPLPDLAVGRPNSDVGRGDVVIVPNVALQRESGIPFDRTAPYSIVDPDGRPNDRFGSSLLAYATANSPRLVVGVPFRDEDPWAPSARTGRSEGFDTHDIGAARFYELDPRPFIGSPDGDISMSGWVDAYDRFGEVIAAGDFNGDTRRDLAFGVRLADPGGVPNAGRVIVRLQGQSGPAKVMVLDRSDEYLDHDPLNQALQLGGVADRDDYLGSALATGDFNDDGTSDLVIGVPHDEVQGAGSPVTNAGSVHVVYGDSSAGPDPRSFRWGRQEILHQNR
ncbi:MAG: FG-GAP repeat protein [Myxococcota bacterium]|nr:FG-GAP repeat protein [Myxococcota bacterium]